MEPVEDLEGTDVGETDDIADVVPFVLRTRPSPEKSRRPPLLEVHQMWGNTLLATRQFPRETDAVWLGLRTGHFWSFLGIGMGWVPAPLGSLLPTLAPIWSDVEARWQSDFVVARDMLPGDADWQLFSRGEDGRYVAHVAAGWDGFADVGGERRSFDDLVADGLATRDADSWRIPLAEGVRLMVEGGGSVFLAQLAAPAPRVFVTLAQETDRVFAGALGVGAAVFLLVLALLWVAPPERAQASTELPPHLVELLLEKPEDPKPEKKRPTGDPEAGAGRKAKKDEGKVGKEDAKLEKAKGHKVDVKRLELDRQVAEASGVLAALDGDLAMLMGSSGLSAELTGGVGSLIGAAGTQVGSNGLGNRGGGLGAGGTADGLGGLGTHGLGGGVNGYGKGGGTYGPKGDGDPLANAGDAIVIGGLDRALIDEVVKRQMSQLRYCYQRELQRAPELGGKVVVKFTIARDGSVSAASTKTTTLNNAAVESCLVGRFLRMQFPQPKGGGIVIVSYPFLFSPG